jgi:hypothetical protein
MHKKRAFTSVIENKQMIDGLLLAYEVLIFAFANDTITLLPPVLDSKFILISLKFAYLNL